MVRFSNCKINIGLNVLKRLPNGYHEIETVFYPAPWFDVIEIVESETLKFESSGIRIPGDPAQNLCLKAYHLIKEQKDIPNVNIHLRKKVPIGAGLGGGSSNGTNTLIALNELFALNFSNEELKSMASKMGADCAFFVENKPVFANGIGDTFDAIDLDLASKQVLIIYPKKLINTNWAYAQLQLKEAQEPSLKKLIGLDIQNWKESLKNDFEREVNKVLPQIKQLKSELYSQNALYTQMTGSGSCVYGIFDKSIDLNELENKYQSLGYLTKTGTLNYKNLFEIKL